MTDVIDLQTRRTRRAQASDDSAIEEVAEGLDLIMDGLEQINRAMQTLRESRGELGHIAEASFRGVEYNALDLWLSLGEEWTGPLSPHFLNWSKLRRASLPPPSETP